MTSLFYIESIFINFHSAAPYGYYIKADRGISGKFFLHHIPPGGLNNPAPFFQIHRLFRRALLLAAPIFYLNKYKIIFMSGNKVNLP